MSKDKKARHWAIIVYPESAPENWRSVLQSTGCEICISPLHDKDINEGTGEFKKAHYHVIISFTNTTTFNNVKTLCDQINTVIPQAINSCKGAIRYMTHLDNPEKAQYDFDQITTINGFNIDDYIKLSVTQIYDIKLQIAKFICDNQINSYMDLILILASKNYDWFKVACDNTMYCNAIIKSYCKRKI